jgi:DUF1680 family protein
MLKRTLLICLGLWLCCFQISLLAQPYDARLKGSEILTPVPASIPRINGPKVYGVRPGKEFIYRIPCQGERPILFKVSGLPGGLELNESEGIISGRVPEKEGNYQLIFSAENKHGTDTRVFRLVLGDKLALTPPVGWNSWGGHMLYISDQIIRKAADILVTKGLADVGFQYVSIDDCWMRISPENYAARSEAKKIQHEGFSYEGLVGEVRDDQGNILPNDDFPDMKAMTDYIHSYGLKAGLYSSPGPYTCQNFAGSYKHEKQDAEQYARWGFDLLKYDLCGGNKILKELREEDPEYSHKEYWKPMATLLKNQNHDILFNLCQYGLEDPWTWAPDLGIQTWRTGGDLNHGVEGYFDQALRLATELRDYSKPGQWNDPDFMYIHKIRNFKKMSDPTVEIPLDLNQRYQYVSLWAITCAPFFFSCDINEIDDFTIGLLGNADVVNINQDELGHVAEVIRRSDQEVIMLKKLADGSRVLGVFNRNPEKEAVIEVSWDELGVSCTQYVYDVWRQKDAGLIRDKFSIRLSPNGVGLFNLRSLISKEKGISAPGTLVSDPLYPNLPANSRIEGFLGQRMDSCIKNGVMAADYHLYSAPFREHADDSGPKFQGEFWGKWYTSAMLAYGYQPRDAYREIIEASLKEILDTQEKDGRISSYSRENTFDMWDIWGRKYVLLGLISNYEQTGNKKALKAACKLTDELISIAGPGKTKLTETGLEVLGSMSSTTILEPVVLVYKYSGEQKYLDFAEFMVSQWSEPNAYTSKGMRLIEDALAGVPPVQISSPKAYEMMSCYEGLCELYRVTGKTEYLDAVVSFANSVLEREIMIVGSGSSAELWFDGAFRQTELLEQPMETCVTVTWLKLCYQLLRLTGDARWADQMELTLYNALLGAMNEGGDWWAYFSSLAGERMPSPMQVPQCHSSCCVVNGPRGLLTVPLWSVMKNEEGPVINLYNQGQWSMQLQDGSEVTLLQETSYPEDGSVLIRVQQEKEAEYTISLRIPSWSRQTELSVNGEKVEVSPGDYISLKRQWHNDDQIRLTLDMRGRVIQAPGNMNDLVLMRGPVVLALDNRLVEPASYNLWLLPDGAEWQHKDELGGVDYILPDTVNESGVVQYITLKPVKDKPKDVWMAFEVPFLYRYTHFFGHEIRPLVMCDYASSGNQYSEENLFRVWLSQPLYMNQVFPKKTWRILYPGEKRPTFPDWDKETVRGNSWEDNN